MLREFGQDGELIDSLPTLDGICLDESESSPKKQKLSRQCNITEEKDY